MRGVGMRQAWTGRAFAVAVLVVCAAILPGCSSSMTRKCRVVCCSFHWMLPGCTCPMSASSIASTICICVRSSAIWNSTGVWKLAAAALYAAIYIVSPFQLPTEWWTFVLLVFADELSAELATRPTGTPRPGEGRTEKRREEEITR